MDWRTFLATALLRGAAALGAAVALGRAATLDRRVREAPLPELEERQAGDVITAEEWNQIRRAALDSHRRVERLEAALD